MNSYYSSIFFPELTLESDPGFLYIGESANMTCTVYTGNITNFSINDFNFIVKKNRRIYYLSSQVSKNSTHVEISTSDLIEDVPEQIFFDYVCQYQGGADICEKRKIIYSDCKKIWIHVYLVKNILNNIRETPFY